MTTFTTDDRIHAEKDGSFTIDCRPKPLTDKEILKYIGDNFTKFGFEADYVFDDMELLEFARAIEQAHGIR